MNLTIKQIEKALSDENKPKGATHYVLDSGINYYFKVVGLTSGIWTGAWMPYDGNALPDLEDCSLIYDLETILSQHKEMENLKATVTTDNTKVNASLIEQVERLEQENTELKGRLDIAEIHLTNAYLAGFKDSGEGFNGEYPFGDNGATDSEVLEELSPSIHYYLKSIGFPVSHQGD